LEIYDPPGTWKDLRFNVNLMASLLTGQVRSLAEVLLRVGDGDFTRKVTVPAAGEMLGLEQSVNLLVDQLRVVSSEISRVSTTVLDGHPVEPIDTTHASGTWKEIMTSVNSMAADQAT
jgi:HAMP domain-containing protein